MAPEQIRPLTEEQFRANRFELVSRLADDLAHEIKNPLNAIVVNLEVLRVRVGRDDREAALERAAVIEHEVRRLHQLLERILLLLRPERDSATQSALDEVLDELLPLVEAQARLARNELVVESAASVHVPLRRDVLKFALLNISTSAHQRLGQGGGTLTFDARKLNGDVLIRIGTLPFARDRALAPEDAAYHEGIAVARQLLASAGGRLTLEDGAVEVLLPCVSGL